MPGKKAPGSLQDLAMKSIRRVVLTMGQHVIHSVADTPHETSEAGTILLQSSLERLNEALFGNVPWYLFDKLSQVVLETVNELIVETRAYFDHCLPISIFVARMNVVVRMTLVAIHPQLKSIDFSAWPKVMRNILYQNLYKMTGLEVLNLGSGSGGWETSDIEKSILSGVVQMKHLVSLCLCFDCTDHILSVVGQNCTMLQKLDVTSSRSVTDRSVPSLLNCMKLKQLLLYRTSVTVEGYAILLSSLPQLEDLGRCDEFGHILERIRGSSKFQGPFKLRYLQSRDVTTSHLYLLIEMCPYVTHVSIFHDERISDLNVLSHLQQLTELKLLSCDFFSDNIKSLLEVKGSNLTWLHLEHVEEIDLNALIYISQFCPVLKKLVLYNCEFMDHSSLSLRTLQIPPFRHLEKVTCIADCAQAHLEFLLSNCFNIRFIQLGSSTGIGDAIMAKVLAVNPMKKLEELRILYSDDLSMHTVALLMTHCENLRVLSELESWAGISKRELAAFRTEILEKNIDLDIRPTLSY
ncbi:SCF E3 ubiquitin ligase complex F-box protein grrA-like isoform X1 [Thrips palmi]|uniref:SCF E3 ubiquitin ligase complex F-box protein grrA-like isoform X1 n=1 Tax=Thrips palmi TaxID=161013 RepID=A0A6P8YAR6_THRPL|nr:SCF E3 ubiquitin ligase complex F-box protein grrA-like isoform X1 [Thrips palmi]